MAVLYTIGFTKRTAESFFEALKKIGARYLIDIRLNNTSQLAGFTKKQDLSYFLKKLVGMDYYELPEMAPTSSILDEYRRSKDWEHYEKAYRELLVKRRAEKLIPMDWIEEGVVLLCSEPEPQHCHRRLAAEYLSIKYVDQIKIIHL